MELVKRNQNPNSPLLIGDVKWGDVVNEVDEPSYIETHEKVYYFDEEPNERILYVIFLAICIIVYIVLMEFYWVMKFSELDLIEKPKEIDFKNERIPRPLLSRG